MKFLLSGSQLLLNMITGTLSLICIIELKNVNLLFFRLTVCVVQESHFPSQVFSLVAIYKHYMAMLCLIK